MWINFERHMREPWTLSVSADADECRRRLGAVTSVLGHRYYLDSANAGNAAPRFRGVNRASYPVQIARWETTVGRDSFVAWFCADLASGDAGGTELRGWIGVDPRWREAWTVWVIASTLVVGLFIYSGVRLAVAGHLVGILIALASLAWPAVNVLIFTYGAQHCRKEGLHLRGAVRDVVAQQEAENA